MLHHLTRVPLPVLEKEAATHTRYATPKIDIRAVIFRGTDAILMVREKADGGRWSLPGGWADVGYSRWKLPSKRCTRKPAFTSRLRVYWHCGTCASIRIRRGLGTSTRHRLPRTWRRYAWRNTRDHGGALGNASEIAGTGTIDRPDYVFATRAPVRVCRQTRSASSVRLTVFDDLGVPTIED
jgi:hypothetical protein